MHAICESCCKADLLKLLATRSTTVGTCSICLNSNRQVIDTEERDFTLAIKALIRYSFSEWDYHSKLGGESFETLLFSENPIFNLNPNLPPLDYEEFLLSFLEDIDSDQEITLFSAYGREIYQYPAMRAISEGDSPLVSDIASDLRRRNHFLVETDNLEHFKMIQDYISVVVEPGTVWHRARIGVTKQASDGDFSPNGSSYYYEPHSDSELGAPPVGTTSAGRLNRPGVSYLYLASDPDTAVAEIRPHPAEFVSLGEFSLSAPQRIADLSHHRIADLFRNDNELEILEIIISIEKALSTAAPPSDRHVYSLTQFLAETFRRLGFDGVKFRSTVGAGVNLVLFDPAIATWMPNSSRVVEVQRVVYEHIDRKLYDPQGEYAIDLKAISRRAAAKKGT